MYKDVQVSAMIPLDDPDQTRDFNDAWERIEQWDTIEDATYTFVQHNYTQGR